MKIDSTGSLAVACFLLRHGANLDARNQRHVTPIMHIVDARVIDIARHYARLLLSAFIGR